MDILVLQSMLLTVAKVDYHGIYQPPRPCMPPKISLVWKHEGVVDIEMDGKT
jgi:hypothetical protein